MRLERKVPQPPSTAAEARPVESEIGALERAGVIALRVEWRRLFGSDPPRLSRDLLVRALAYRVQERAMGGLSRASLKRLRELAENPEGRGPPPEQAASLRPGAKLDARMARPHACRPRDRHRFRLCGIELQIVDADRQADHRRSLVGTALLRPDEQTAHAGARRMVERPAKGKLRLRCADLYPQIQRGGTGTGVQLARRAAGGLRGLYRIATA